MPITFLTNEDKVLEYKEQALTNDEKAQACKNIGAAVSGHGHDAATASAAGFMSTDSQTFAGDKTFNGAITAKAGITSGGNIVSDTAGTDNLGSGSIPWKNVYSPRFNLYGNSDGEKYGAVSVQTAGTASAQGMAELELGNSTATGTAGNARSRVRMYNSGAYSTSIEPSEELTESNVVCLPAQAGTLALQSEIPTKTSELTNDSGFITSAPVSSVNGKTGAVSLSASDVGAAASDHNHDSAYLKKTGGTLTGALEIQASSAKMQLENPNASGRYFYMQQWANGSVDFSNHSSGQDFTCLKLLGEGTVGTDFLKASRQVDGQPENYTVLHTGNSNKSTLVATETNPTVNGVINWTYE